MAFFEWPFFLAMLHAAEDLLSAIRTGEKTFDANSVDALGACINQTEAWLTSLATSHALPANGEARAAPVTRALEQALRVSVHDNETSSRDAAAEAQGHEAVVVSHQLPIWMARCDAEGRRQAHDPRKRECRLASVTSFTLVDGRVVAVDYAEPAAALYAGPRPRKFAAGA